MRHATFSMKAATPLGAENVSPVARHVAIKRQEWRDRLAEYERAEYADIGGLSEDEQDAAYDRAGEALNALAGTRVPDLPTLADKMRLMHKTGTVMATGYFEDLLDDIDALAKRAVIVPTVRDVRVATSALIKRGLAKIEPWYGWRRADIYRIDAHERDFSDESAGNAFQFEIQWFGVHLGIEIGWTPRKLTQSEIAENRQRLASRSSSEAEG